MSKKNRPEGKPMTNTLQLDDPADELLEAAEAETELEVYEPIEEPAGVQNTGEQYARAEKVLTVVTGVLSCLLIIGSTVFWWYFASRLSICPLIINDYQIYRVMLVGCAAVPLAGVAIQALRRSPASSEGWMMNMCLSGVVTAVFAVIYSLAVMNGTFDMYSTLTVLCFSVSGCALPAAVYTVARWLLGLLAVSVREAASRSRDAVYASVIDQCEGRF